MPLTDDDRTMLCLAALTYRGFGSARHEERHDAYLEYEIVHGLVDLHPLDRRWDLVWGPATYRAVGSVFDDAMMFVAYDRAKNRYAIAVRGTNPISSFDWLLGDLWVAEQLPWPYGRDDGKGPALSLSTALGLHVLQNLRSDSETASADDGDAAIDRDLFGAVPDLLSGFAEPPLIRALPGLSAESELELLLARWQQSGRSELLDAAVELQHRLGRWAHGALFFLLERSIGLRARLGSGETLRAFLERVIAAHRAKGEPFEIAVTGHSKGGALAPALALWIAETLDADVSCWSFAGPSPGNEAFAHHFHERLGRRFRAIVNPLDLVPHAWESRTLKELPDLYAGVYCRPPLSTMIHLLRKGMTDLERAGRGYAHLSSNPIPCDPGPKADEPDYLAHVVHHHLDGYFIGAGLDLRAPDFFDPFAR